MRKPTYHQINPLIRLKETELLSEQQFQQLLEAETVEDVKNMLKSTVYLKRWEIFIAGYMKWLQNQL